MSGTLLTQTPTIRVVVQNVTTALLAVIQAQDYGQYRIFNQTGETLRIRVGMREGLYVIDKELIENGFSGVEGTGWEQIGGEITE